MVSPRVLDCLCCVCVSKIASTSYELLAWHFKEAISYTDVRGHWTCPSPTVLPAELFFPNNQTSCLEGKWVTGFYTLQGACRAHVHSRYFRKQGIPSLTVDRPLPLNFRHSQLYNINPQDAKRQITGCFWKVCDTKLVNKSLFLLPKCLIEPFRSGEIPEDR